MEIKDYILDQALIMIPVLNILGKVLKSVPLIANWVIPVVLLVPGVVGAMALGGWTVESAIQGILVTGAAVYGNQLYKQLHNGS
ncbi:MAG: phage holin family protein [Christensenellales bacterium]